MHTHNHHLKLSWGEGYKVGSKRKFTHVIPVQPTSFEIGDLMMISWRFVVMHPKDQHAKYQLDQIEHQDYIIQQDGSIREILHVAFSGKLPPIFGIVYWIGHIRYGLGPLPGSHYVTWFRARGTTVKVMMSKKIPRDRYEELKVSGHGYDIL